MPLRVAASFDWGTTAGMATGNTGNRLVDAFSGATTIVTTSPRTGTHCLQLAPSAASAHVDWTTNTITASQTRMLFAFGLYAPTSVPTVQILAQTIQAAGLSAIFTIDSSDRLNANWEGGNASTDFVTLSPDTWYWIEGYVDVSANPNTFRWWVDGTEYAQVDQGQAASSYTTFLLGTTNSETWTLRYDDLLLLTDNTFAISAPIGPHKVVMLKPDTGGTAVELGTANAVTRFVTNSTADTTFNSANILAAISEVPPLLGATASGVAQRTSGATNAVAIPMTTYTLAAGESFPTFGVRVLGCGWAASATANNIGLRIYNGSIEDTLFAAADPGFDNSTTAPAWLCKPLQAARFDIQAEVNAMELRVGYSTDVSPVPGFHALYVEVPVTLATGGAPSTSMPPQQRAIRRRAA